MCYRRHENKKHQVYEQRVRKIENGSFTPLVFSTSGDMGKAAKITCKRLAYLLSIKREQPYSLVMGWLQCRLSFSLLRSAVMCLRGSRSKKGHVPLSDTHIELVVHEGCLPLSSWILRVFLSTFCNIFFTPYNYESFLHITYGLSPDCLSYCSLLYERYFLLTEKMLKSVVITDNASIHHVDSVVETLSSLVS